MMSPLPTAVGSRGDMKMIIDRTVHFALGYIVAFGGTILMLPVISNVLSLVGIG